MIMTMTMLDWPALVAIVVGHVAFFALALNLMHSTGMPESRLDRLSLVLLLWTVLALPLLLTQGPWTGWALPARAYAWACLAMAVVALPAATLVRAARKVPPGVSGRSDEVALEADPGRDRWIGEGRFGWLLRLPGNQSLQLRRVDCEVRLPGLPPALDGLTVVQVSDTHFSPCYRREFFERAVEQAARWEADLVVFTGDLLDDEATAEWVVPVMGRLRGRLGQFAILGNHDHRLDPRRAMLALGDSGFDDLEGRWARLALDGATIALGGTSEPWGPRLDYRAMPEADLHILLSHSPDQFFRARAHGIDLVLAGHNHGGQIRLPILGPILMPSRYSRHFDRGFFRSRGTFMYVSQGVGGKHPIRYGCPPEVTRVTLRAVAAGKADEGRAELSIAVPKCQTSE